jgi:ribosomal protein S16
MISPIIPRKFPWRRTIERLGVWSPSKCHRISINVVEKSVTEIIVFGNRKEDKVKMLGWGGLYWPNTR